MSSQAAVGIFITALTLAIVASLESLLCAEATDKLDPQKRVTPKNRELIAQGVGNILSGIIGGLPVTQVIVRSSANLQSGGKTKSSAIIHGFLLLKHGRSGFECNPEKKFFSITYTTLYPSRII